MQKYLFGQLNTCTQSMMLNATLPYAEASFVVKPTCGGVADAL
jgi:hypothetical protein